MSNTAGVLTEGSFGTVWCLYIWGMDADCGEWETLEEIYHVKPSVDALKERFKYHSVKESFFETLVEKGEAYGGGYDNWHFTLEEKKVV